MTTAERWRSLRGIVAIAVTAAATAATHASGRVSDAASASVANGVAQRRPSRASREAANSMAVSTAVYSAVSMPDTAWTAVRASVQYASTAAAAEAMRVLSTRTSVKVHAATSAAVAKVNTTPSVLATRSASACNRCGMASSAIHRYDV